MLRGILVGLLRNHSLKVDNFCIAWLISSANSFKQYRHNLILLCLLHAHTGRSHTIPKEVHLLNDDVGFGQLEIHIRGTILGGSKTE